MRRHGWQLPYHPLQVVAIAVFLALGFAFYVFFLPFVGNKVFEYVVMGLYTPLVACVFSLYVWCAATDPGDPGVFKSRKYLGENIEKPLDERTDSKKLSDRLQKENLTLVHCCFHANEKPFEGQTSEDGMFYCSLCEVEVLKHSKHCRVCDKCVDGFDHHCRWLNNCIGRRNYGRFFALMIFTLLLLILQWSIGILVLILCCLEQKRFNAEIRVKLGSSFSLAPFITVLASCTLLAMIATLPLGQLLFFHVLLIKKGISTYDYIVALREQEQEQGQQGVGQQSPPMSSMSSITGLSSTSSFGAFRRDAWCTPPRLFLEDQFDVIPPGLGLPQKFAGKKMVPEESPRKRNTAPVKISPWTLARLDPEQVSNAAEQAKQKSKTLRPVHKTDGSRMKAIKSLGPLQIAARSAFKTNRAMSSPDSSLGSPDIHPCRVSSSGPENLRGVTQLSSGDDKGIQFLRSTSSDGYEASGGEDSDRVPAKIVHRSLNWNNFMDVRYGEIADEFKASSSSSLKANGN